MDKNPPLFSEVPEPLPPEPVADDECCQSGCDVCVLDVYAQALAQWRVDHAAWLLRQRVGQQSRS